MVQSPWKTVFRFLIKLDTYLLNDPATPVLGIYPRGKETYVHTKTHLQMFIAALFITAKT